MEFQYTVRTVFPEGNLQTGFQIFQSICPGIPHNCDAVFLKLGFSVLGMEAGPLPVRHFCTASDAAEQMTPSNVQVSLLHQ